MPSGWIEQPTSVLSVGVEARGIKTDQKQCVKVCNLTLLWRGPG
jgi:hypothetical protein